MPHALHWSLGSACYGTDVLKNYPLDWKEKSVRWGYDAVTAVDSTVLWILHGMLSFCC